MSQVVVNITVKSQKTLWICFVLTIIGAFGGYLHHYSEKFGGDDEFALINEEI